MLKSFILCLGVVCVEGLYASIIFADQERISFRTYHPSTVFYCIFQSTKLVIMCVDIFLSLV